ncbi:MAG TPA: hypothetical protein VGD80_04410 [Kofleriaceae bacterium]
MPDAARRAASELRSLPRVVSVSWGLPRRGEQRALGRAPCLVVHVRLKRDIADVPDDERIPKTLYGIRTDVVAVGLPRLHALDHVDAPFASPDRRGSITAIGVRGGAAVVLLSGHASLPPPAGEIVRTYRAAADGPASVQIRDDAGGSYTASLIVGTFGGSTDWAVASVDIPMSKVSTWHQAAGANAPLPVRTAPLPAGSRVAQHSTRGKIFAGVVQHGLTPVSLDLDDGSDPVDYEPVIHVDPLDPPSFSIGGDSGSLVVDEQRRVVGVVIGGASNGAHSYVLPISGIYAQLGQYRKHFFQ